MRVLLIHNDNLNQRLINSFDEDDTLIFSIPPQTLLNPNFSFDKEAHEQLEDHFEECGKYDLIVLPFNLSSDNYLEFSGVQIANHIRLTKEWGHHKTPILFLGEETNNQIARLLRADILFTKGVFFSRDQSNDEVERWVEKLQELKFEITNEDYQEIVDKIILEPPNDYDSHHNLDNEFSLFLWSKAIGLELAALKKEIESGLYFKWWCLRNKIEIGRTHEILEENTYPNKDGSNKKILLVDDQHKKGWYLFFKKLFPTIHVDFLDGDFQKPDHFCEEMNIVDCAIDKISSFDPDIVLLDLRLTDADNEKDKSELTGVKILEKIRTSNAINQGIQIVITSASDKIWNYTELSKRGINGYIIKSATKQFENHPVSSIIQLINKLIPRATYLKSIFKMYDFVKVNYKELIRENTETYEANLDVAFELTLSSFDKQKNLTFAYLILYQLFETFLKSEAILKEDSEKFIIFNGETGIVFRKLIKDRSVFNEKIFDQIITNLNLLHNDSEGVDKERIKKQIDFYSEWKNDQDNKFCLWNNPIKIELQDEKVKLSLDKNRIEKENPNFSLSKDVTRKAAYVLAYRYGYNKDKMQEFNNIRIIRNTKTAHGEKNQELVTYDEMKTLWEFISFLFNPASLKRNYQDYEIESFSVKNKGPHVKVVGKIDLAALQKKFNSRNK